MKNIAIIIITIFLMSCSRSYVQVFNTESTNTQIKDYYIYETDSVKITYSFWKSNGIMSFTVFNKLNTPLYIDWKNSSFIVNDNKLDYWSDAVSTKTTGTASYYGGYFYKGPLLIPGNLLMGFQNSTSKTVKEEKVTFIPPKSNYSRSQFILLPDYYKFSSNYASVIVPENDNLKKKTTVYSEDFSLNNSPLRFRNYLAFAFAENSQQYFFIDNGFYVNSVKEMVYQHFRGKLLKTKDGSEEYERPFNKPTSFYILIDESQSIKPIKK